MGRNCANEEGSCLDPRILEPGECDRERHRRLACTSPYWCCSTGVVPLKEVIGESRNAKGGEMLIDPLVYSVLLAAH